MGLQRLALVVIVAALAAPAARAQVDAAGLGARRDTFDLRAGATHRLRAPALPRSLALTLLRRDTLGLRPVGVLADLEYRFDDATSTLTLVLPEALAADSTLSVVVAYRTLDLGLRAEYRRAVDSVRVPAPTGLPGPRLPAPAAPADPVFADVRLRRSGSITRGLIAGNNRDLAVESGLRMELSGEVAEGVNVEAVLTDASTPILPEGTTQQLSEFDRVYVRIFGSGAEARLGDVDLALTGTRFADLARRVQGAAVEARLSSHGALAGGRVLAAGAAARGVFRSQAIGAIEGVQGPYRLTGAAGEAFVIVVPASERVYLDGVLVTRGENADYIIDYATGEVTFTSRRLITAERRITVDFEYTAGGFTRTLMVAAGEARLFPRGDSAADGLRLRAAFLREGDAAGLSLALSSDELDAIAAAGDADVLVPGEERVPFDPASPFVLYARRDTVFGGAAYSIFVPAVAATDSVYRVRFTRVEAGRGSYTRGGAVQNGVLFRWVGPTGGDYIPFRRLPRPERRRVIDLRAEAAPLPGVDLWAEWASSGNDRNTLSDIDAGDDGGQAVEAGAALRPLRVGALGALSATARLGRRAASFAPLDRTRPVEFGRTWNVDRGGAPAFAADTLTESLGEASARWAISPRSALVVEAGALYLDDPDTGDFSASRGALDLRFEEPSLLSGFLPMAEYRLDVADSRDRLAIDTLAGISSVSGRLVRGQGVVRRPMVGGRLTPSVGVQHERRTQRGPDGSILGGISSDTTGGSFASFLPVSYGFVAFRPGLAWSARTLDASFGVEHRTEDEPFGGALVGAADGLGAEGEVRWRPGGTYSAEGRIGWRRRQYREAFRAIGREDAESLALRWTARAAPFRRALEATATYEALTERAPVLQETYVLVGPELGTHVWRDGEGEPRAGEPDGLAQVDEFFPETTPLEGTYARTYVPGDDLFPAVGVQAHLRLRFDPSRLVSEAATDGMARLARGLALTTTVDVRERTREDDLLRVLLLDPGVLQRPGAAGDSSGTLAGRFRLQQELSLLPSNPRGGGRVSFAALSTTNRLAAGLERRRLRQVDAEARLVPTPGLTLRLRSGWGHDRSDSDAFLTRTFDLTTLSIHPEATWAPATGVSVTAGVAYADRANAGALVGQPTGARMWRLPLEARAARAGRLALGARAEWANVDVLGGEGGGLLSYELTEGRGPGTSYLWGANLDYTLTRYLRASAFYDGRAPAGARAVHTFRMQLSASF